MPHVSVKLYPGKSDEQKARLSEAMVQDIHQFLGDQDDAVSISFEEINASDWMAKVYIPEIDGKWHALTKEPGYGPRFRRR